MSSNATTSSATRRNRFSLRLFAAFCAPVLFALASAVPASAETCASAFANWSTGSRLVHSITSSSSYAHEIDEWDSDVVKIRHNMPGVLIIGAKGVAIEGTLYVWDEANSEADLVGSEVLGGETGNTYTTVVEDGDYCFEITNYGESEGDYELNINFLDGCTLGTLAPTFCQQM